MWGFVTAMSAKARQLGLHPNVAHERKRKMGQECCDDPARITWLSPVRAGDHYRGKNARNSHSTASLHSQKAAVGDILTFSRS